MERSLQKAERSLKTISVVMIEVILVLWMVLYSFIISSIGCTLVLIALIVGAIQIFRIPPLRESRISDSVLDLFKIDEENLKKSTIFHKGGAGMAPGNTMEAVQKAIEHDVAGIEIDVSVTKDGVCVLFHGPKLEETTEGTGDVFQFSFDELQNLNASTNDPNKDKYPVTRIPKLEDCVTECIMSNMLIFFDCKGDSKQTVHCLLELYKKYPELYRIGVVCSFYPQTIYSLRQKDSNIVTALTIRNNIVESSKAGEPMVPRHKELWKRILSPLADRLLMWLHITFFWYFTGASFVLLEKGAISADFKAFWAKLGLRTIAWTVNCPLERQFLMKNLGIPVISDMLTNEVLK